MTKLPFSLPLSSAQRKFAAFSRSLAIIEFDVDGTLRLANENFLKTVGYELHEIKGKHHSMFCDAAYASSAEYKDFWSKLGKGEFSGCRIQTFW